MKTILIVDDVDSIRFYHQMLLKKTRGYGVLSANNGVAALDLLAKQPVDLVLLDLMMPQMNGFELIKAIRATVKHASLPIIVISSEAQRGETKNLPTETGHCVALQKPVSPENILKAVDYLLR